MGGGPIQPAEACSTFTPGVTIHGTYSVSDEYFCSLTMSVRPAAVAGCATVAPPSRVYGAPDFVPTTGDSGTWTLDTIGMQPCGYTIELHAIDRTIVRGGSGWDDSDFVGFCLEHPPG